MKTLNAVMAVVVMSVQVDAAMITYDFGGQVSRILGENGLSVVIGEPVIGSVTMDLSRTTPGTWQENWSTYNEMVVDFHVHVAGIDFAPIANPGYSIVSIRNDYANDDELRDVLQITSTQLTGGGMDMEKMSFGLQDRTAQMFDDLSLDNLHNIQLFEHDGITFFKSAGITVDSRSGFQIDWQTFNERLQGDANQDGIVDAADLNALALNWRGESNWNGGDFTADGVVNAADLNELALNWQGPVISAAAVPEPAAIVMAVMAILAFVTGRHHARI